MASPQRRKRSPSSGAMPKSRQKQRVKPKMPSSLPLRPFFRNVLMERLRHPIHQFVAIGRLQVRSAAFACRESFFLEYDLTSGEKELLQKYTFSAGFCSRIVRDLQQRILRPTEQRVAALLKHSSIPSIAAAAPGNIQRRVLHNACHIFLWHLTLPPAALLQIPSQSWF